MTEGGTVHETPPGRPKVSSMHNRLLVVLAALACAACSSSSTSSGSGGGSSGSSSNPGTCNPPYGFPDAGAGVVACTVGQAYVECTSSNGGCGCISDNPSECPGCSASNGFTCTNKCSTGYFGVSCGGPPNPVDGGPNYQSLPSGCVSVGNTPGGTEFACCPCGTH